MNDIVYIMCVQQGYMHMTRGQKLRKKDLHNLQHGPKLWWWNLKWVVE